MQPKGCVVSGWSATTPSWPRRGTPWKRRWKRWPAPSRIPCVPDLSRVRWDREAGCIQGLPELLGQWVSSAGMRLLDVLLGTDRVSYCGADPLSRLPSVDRSDALPGVRGESLHPGARVAWRRIGKKRRTTPCIWNWRRSTRRGPRIFGRGGSSSRWELRRVFRAKAVVDVGHGIALGHQRHSSAQLELLRFLLDTPDRTPGFSDRGGKTDTMSGMVSHRVFISTFLRSRMAWQIASGGRRKIRRTLPPSPRQSPSGSPAVPGERPGNRWPRLSEVFRPRGPICRQAVRSYRCR